MITLRAKTGWGKSMQNIICKFDINNKPVHLHKKLTGADQAFELTNVRLFDYKSIEDYQRWCSIINAAYKEENYTLESAKCILENHPFLQDTETFFYLNENKEPVGTISIGIYRDCPDVAGDFRLAVYPDLQNLGIGGGVITVCEP